MGKRTSGKGGGTRAPFDSTSLQEPGWREHPWRVTTILALLAGNLTMAANTTANWLSAIDDPTPGNWVFYLPGGVPGPDGSCLRSPLVFAGAGGWLTAVLEQMEPRADREPAAFPMGPVPPGRDHEIRMGVLFWDGQSFMVRPDGDGPPMLVGIQEPPAEGTTCQ